MNEKTTSLLWFQRFLFVPPSLTVSYYPFFAHRAPDAIFALHALLSLAND